MEIPSANLLPYTICFTPLIHFSLNAALSPPLSDQEQASGCRNSLKLSSMAHRQPGSQNCQVLDHGVQFWMDISGSSARVPETRFWKATSTASSLHSKFVWVMLACHTTSSNCHGRVRMGEQRSAVAARVSQKYNYLGQYHLKTLV